jgi:hypothetical protein
MTGTFLCQGENHHPISPDLGMTSNWRFAIFLVYAFAPKVAEIEKMVIAGVHWGLVHPQRGSFSRKASSGVFG